MTAISSRHTLGEQMQACTGCAACAAACPQRCISMQPDAEGFVQPQIDALRCNGCNVCRRICPAMRPPAVSVAGETSKDSLRPFPQVFAAWHLDETVRRESSSGGVFTALAEYVLGLGGVVVGAAFDAQLVVRHVMIERSDDLHRLRGAKYVQSDLSPDLIRHMQGQLKQGGSVLFSGTPCQVAGVRSALDEGTGRLLCCDVACHGVPSPRLLERYIEHHAQMGGPLRSLSFRAKAPGWKTYSVRRESQDGDARTTPMRDDPYMAAFLRDYALRPACYACKFASTTRTSDLTIADFWGVANRYPEYDRDDKGTSLVLANNARGLDWLTACRASLFVGEADIETAIAGNPVLIRACGRPPERDTFYGDVKTLSFEELVRRYRLCGPPLTRRVLSRIKASLSAIARRCGAGGAAVRPVGKW